MATSPFNSDLETGLRVLSVLTATYPVPADIQRLMAYEYLLVHSADAGSPDSLHPGVPQRIGELLVRHTIVQNGLFLLLSRNLIDRLATENGIEYCAENSARSFLDQLSSPYVQALRERADWIATTFGDMSNDDLRAFVRTRFGEWMTEFHFPDAMGAEQ
jgi:hypothetical protein